jgi:hypothetical protein
MKAADYISLLYTVMCVNKWHEHEDKCLLERGLKGRAFGI